MGRLKGPWAQNMSKLAKLVLFLAASTVVGLAGAFVLLLAEARPAAANGR